MNAEKVHGRRSAVVMDLSAPAFDVKAKAKALEDSTRELTEHCQKRVVECQAAIDELRNQYAEIIAEATVEAESIKQAAIEEACRTTANVNAEKTAWEQERAQLAHTQKFEGIIKLNVGGKKFATSLATLRRCPDTMIGAMFSGRHELHKDDEGNVFIDRDGTYFEEILNFLRSPETYEVDLPPAELNKLKQQCAYYGLLETMFPFIPAAPWMVRLPNGDNCEITQDDKQLWYGNKNLFKVCRSCFTAQYSSPPPPAPAFGAPFPPAGSGFSFGGGVGGGFGGGTFVNCVQNFTNGSVKRKLCNEQPQPDTCVSCGAVKK
jgi:hypothetical protein